MGFRLPASLRLVVAGRGEYITTQASRLPLLKGVGQIFILTCRPAGSLVPGGPASTQRAAGLVRQPTEFNSFTGGTDFSPEGRQSALFLVPFLTLFDPTGPRELFTVPTNYRRLVARRITPDQPRDTQWSSGRMGPLPQQVCRPVVRAADGCA
jgi:hypothetical protein